MSRPFQQTEKDYAGIDPQPIQVTDPQPAQTIWWTLRYENVQVTKRQEPARWVLSSFTDPLFITALTIASVQWIASIYMGNIHLLVAILLLSHILHPHSVFT